MKRDNKDNSDLTIYNNSNKNQNIYVNNRYNDYELNNLSYQEALKEDKINFSEYYLSLLKYNQLLIFTFYTYDDYNSKIIKISLFLLLISLCFSVNALFFNNDAIHTIYLNKGAYDFIYQLPKIIYSSLISTSIKIIISYFSLTEKNIIKFKKAKDNKIETITKFFHCLIIKFIVFYFLTYIFLIMFWYYLGCFCVIYKNSQIHVIKDTLISILISLLYPFGLSLLPRIFRVKALKDKNSDKECLYKFSKLLQLI